MSCKIKEVKGSGIYVSGSDIDTDQIIPGRYLTCVTFDELAPALFYDARYDSAGNLTDHALNLPQAKTAKVLIGDHNFGCGSSREHAPQAIKRWGFEAVIAGSFAEIFRSNCIAIGLPCIELADEQRKVLLDFVEAEPALELMIDLERQMVIANSKKLPFVMKNSIREAFTQGIWDPLNQLLAAQTETRALAEKLGYV